MRLNHQTWKDNHEGLGHIAFEVVVVDNFDREIMVEGVVAVSKGGEAEIILKSVAGERKFNNLLFTDKYKEHISLIKKYVQEKGDLLETHLQIMKDYTLNRLGCHLSEVPEYYESSTVGVFITSKSSLDSALEIIISQGATYEALYNIHPFKYQIDGFMERYEMDLKSVNRALNKEIIQDLSPQYLSRLESLKVGDILNEEKMELLPLKLMSAPISIEETKGTIIPFELFVTKYSNMATKLGLLIANKFFKKRGFPSTVEKFFSSMEEERNSPILDKSVMAQTHIILRVVLQGLEGSLEGMNGVFTNLQKTVFKERVVTFPTPSNTDLDNSLVYAIMTLEEYKGRPIKHIENTHFISRKVKAA